ncbi:MAG TPA: DUF4870 domain-containing protein [Anaerolineales bacterium]|nr:DUF4870 domain-containing protein [Anaerolineales bacterium]
MNEQPFSQSSDDNLLAAIAHFFGFLVALIVWVTQKDKSRFVRFQSIQAMVFDISVSIIMLLVVGFVMILVFGSLALGIGDLVILGSQGNPTAEPVRTVVALLTAVPFLIPCILIPVVGVIFVIRLVATIQTFQGKNFHYPWLGRWVEGMLS